MPKKERSFPDIEINGRIISHHIFKIHELEDDEVPGLLEDIRQLGIYARNDPGTELLDLHISNNPIFHAEGLVRHQLNKLLNDKYISNSDLKTPSDFLHEDNYIRGMCCIKTSFLFNFLRDIVSMKKHPEDIDDNAIAKFECNLRGLFFLAESQINGAKAKNNDGPDVFHVFAYRLWKKYESKTITAVDFWRRATKFLIEDDGEYVFKWGNHQYVVRLLPYPKKDDEKYRIKIDCETKGIKGSEIKGANWSKEKWPKLRRKFIKDTK